MVLRLLTKDENLLEAELTKINLTEKFQVGYTWESMDCELVTPIHGGGVTARESDDKLPIRVAAIRGQLRFGWRMLAKYEWKLTDNELRKQEFALWGGMEDGDENGKASLVFLRVQLKNKFKAAPLSDYVKNINDTLGYALFTARGTRNGLPEMKLGKEGLQWQLQWQFSKSITDQQREQFFETLRWWVTLGGIGGRIRRGCGVFLANHDEIKLVSEQEMKEMGCSILFLGGMKNSVTDAWKDAVDSWKETRRKYKAEFKYLLGKDNVHSRHVATVLSRPVFDKEKQKWCGMVIMLPNSGEKIKEILGVPQ